MVIDKRHLSLIRSFPDARTRSAAAAEATDPNYLKDKWNEKYPGWNKKPSGHYVVAESKPIPEFHVVVRRLKRY